MPIFSRACVLVQQRDMRSPACKPFAASLGILASCYMQDRLNFTSDGMRECFCLTRTRFTVLLIVCQCRMLQCYREISWFSYLEATPYLCSRVHDTQFTGTYQRHLPMRQVKQSIRRICRSCIFSGARTGETPFRAFCVHTLISSISIIYSLVSDWEFVSYQLVGAGDNATTKVIVINCRLTSYLIRKLATECETRDASAKGRNRPFDSGV